MEKRSLVLRDYQEGAVDAALRAAHDNLRPIVELPVGTGKSPCIAELAHRILSIFPGWRVLVLHHSSELIKQNERTFRELLRSPFKTGIVAKKLDRSDWYEPVVFASINSVYKQPLRFKNVCAVIVDECHLVGTKQTSMFLSFLNGLWAVNKQFRLFGFTGTSFRLGLGPLTNGNVFNYQAYQGCSTEAWNFFLQEGWLTRLVPKRTTSKMDLEGIKTSGGDYQSGQMNDRFSKDIAATMEALREAMETAGHRRKWLVFCTGTEHADVTAKVLNQLGRRAAAVHSKLGDVEQEKYISQFRHGQLSAIVNMNMLTTGFDVPDVDCIVMLRPTKSPNLWVQMLGRGTRPVYAHGFPTGTAEQRLEAMAVGPKPNCLVLDFARNTERLGPINDPVIPTPKGTKKGPLKVPMKLCDKCEVYNPIAAVFCECCGEAFPYESKIEQKASTLELITPVERPPNPVVQYWVERMLPRATPTAAVDMGKIQITFPTVKGHRKVRIDLSEKWQQKLWRNVTDIAAPATQEEAVALYANTATPLAVLMKRNTMGKVYVDKCIFDEGTLGMNLKAFGDQVK